MCLGGVRGQPWMLFLSHQPHLMRKGLLPEPGTLRLGQANWAVSSNDPPIMDTSVSTSVVLQRHLCTR